MAEAALLSVRGLHTWFELRRWAFFHAGCVRAVDGVSLELRRGETVAVVGESGCGKSSLARTILGLHIPVRGEILFEGRRLTAGAELARYRSRVGYVQQDPYGALAPFMNVRRILEEPLAVSGVRPRASRLERVRAALEEVGLVPAGEFLPRFPHMLSGGQQQRLVIARALILGPRLIVADEPVSMLDASVRVEVLQLLRELQRRRELGLVYITHDLSTVRHFCHRILIMYGGRIIEEAPAERLVAEPRHPYTRALLAAIPDPDPDNALRTREVPPGEPPSLLHPPSGCRFHPRCHAFMPGTCDAAAPESFEAGPEHLVACYLHAGKRSEGQSCR